MLIYIFLDSGQIATAISGIYTNFLPNKLSRYKKINSRAYELYNNKYDKLQCCNTCFRVIGATQNQFQNTTWPLFYKYIMKILCCILLSVKYKFYYTYDRFISNVLANCSISKIQSDMINGTYIALPLWLYKISKTISEKKFS